MGRRYDLPKCFKLQRMLRTTLRDEVARVACFLAAGVRRARVKWLRMAATRATRRLPGEATAVYRNAIPNEHICVSNATGAKRRAALQAK